MATTEYPLVKVIQFLGSTDPTTSFTKLSIFTKAEDYGNLDCDANTSAGTRTYRRRYVCLSAVRQGTICSVIAAGAYDTSKCATDIEVLV